MFSIKESIKYGWNKSKENMELVLFATLLVLAVSSLIGGLGSRPGISLFGFIVTIFVIIVRIGYTKIFLKIYDGESPKFVEIFEEYKTFWRYLGVSILMPLTILGGLILLIIPGLIWAVRFSFSPIIVVDTKIGPIASMKESYAITKGNFWKILLFWITIGLVNLLGFICLGIGLLVTVPVSTFASVYVYRTLSKTKAGLVEASSPQTA
jgi:uncharacterized membrane protein